MNERIKQLLVTAGEYEMDINDPEFVVPDTLKKFAELIVRECIEAIQNESMNSYDDWERGLRIAEGAIEKHFGVEE